LCTNNENGICENVTYQRLKTVITGKRADGSEYSEGIPANLMYYKTDFVAKDSDELADELLDHIVEMIQLEHGVKVDGKQYVVIMDDEEMDAFEQHFDEYTELKAVFVNSDILLSAAQESLLQKSEFYIIPDYYFDFELREAGEIW
ncbi:MAG TPA: site-specific DNA-methyltransferase, partial [Ruminococcus sp.]|nr:site-specific DNA-methyltransferase [Ruminococcus sp.]